MRRWSGPVRGPVLAVAVLIGATAPARGAPGPQLLGDPGGMRSRLERLGVTLQPFSNHFGSWLARGGSPDGDDFGHSASYDLLVHTDLEELAGMQGASFLLHAKGQYDHNLNREIGALSDPIDDADLDEALYLSELWLQQAFLGGRVRFRFGLFEQQVVFDRNAYANSEDRQFLATYLDNNGVVPLPSGIGVVLLAELAPWLELAAGVADADNVPPRVGFSSAFDDLEGLTAHVEATARLRLPDGRPGSYRLGVFRDARERVLFAEAGDPSAARRGHWGAYLSLDQQLLREGGDAAQGLGLFARAGYADPDASRVAWFWSAGLHYQGPLPGRDADVLGLGVYQTIPSDAYREEVDPEFTEETGFELYYAVALFPWLVVTPDLQVILDPGGERRSTVLLCTLRLRLAF